MEGLTPAGGELPRLAYAGSLDSESANHYEFPRRYPFSAAYEQRREATILGL
jgi:hypothetical protein